MNKWIEAHKELLGRPLLPSDTLFPRSFETVTEIDFVLIIFQVTFMETSKTVVSSCAIIPLNVSVEEIEKLTAHVFTRGGDQHRFVTGISSRPPDVVKC